jgi:signal transduction histidine kinase/tetratricopeptide (TPR) repeat protein
VIICFNYACTIFYLLKKRYLFTAVFVFHLSSVYSQQSKIDSLEVVIKDRSGIERYDPIISLVREYAAYNDSEAYKRVLEAKEIAFQYGDSAKIVNSSRIVGQLLNRLTRPKEAEDILLKTLPIAKRNNLRSDYKIMLSNLALAYTIQAKYDKALEVNFQTLLMREEDKDEAEISVSLNNIGLVYFKLKNYEKALDYYDRALNLKRKVNDRSFLDRLLVNIGLCYNQLKNFTNAHKYFQLAFKECGDNCNEQTRIEGNFGLGVSYYGKQEFTKAKEYFNLSYSIAKKNNNTRFEAENLIYLAHIFVRQNDNVAAIKALVECEQIAIKWGYNEVLIETYKEFSKLYDKSKDYENASAYQNKYIHLKDSIYSETLIKNLARIQTDYEERENKAIIATKEEVIQRQHSLNIAIGIIAVLALLLIFVLVYTNRARKRVNLALTEANEIIELKNKELDKKVAEKTADLEVANESLSQVNEELDNFIYKTSHDIRGPLASLKGICNVALMDVKDLTALDYLRKLDITAEHLNTILTRLLIINQINNSAMKPELINFDGIVDEVLLLERKKGLPGGLNIRRHIQENTRFYSDKEFIRIIMENLIDNAIKFYNDSNRIDPFVDIFVEQTDDEIKIRVVDNGIGISEVKPDKIFQMFSRASERSGTGGIGLYITKTATEKLGGSVGLKTTPEGHTQFYVKFPLKQQWFEDPAWSS